MIKSSCPCLFLLAIAFIISLLFTNGNCNNNYDNQMERALYEKHLLARNHFLNQRNSATNNNNDYIDDIRIFYRDLLKPYPNRRSSFHAMRGKRQIILP